MLDARLPSANEVNGDLIQAAQPMLLLGWQAPAVLTARVALERSLLTALETFGLDCLLHRPSRLRDMLDALEGSGAVRRRFRKDLVGPYVAASRVAHGEHVSLHDAVNLIEEIAWYCGELDALQPEGGAPC